MGFGGAIFELLAENQYEKCEQELQKLLEFQYEWYYTHEEQYNPGQSEIWGWYLGVAIWTWIDEEQVPFWPFVEVESYLVTAYSSYQHEVLERAFSRVIENPSEKMYEHIERAKGHYMMALFFEMMAFVF